VQQQAAAAPYGVQESGRLSQQLAQLQV
jgi:hypothetical protein